MIIGNAVEGWRWEFLYSLMKNNFSYISIGLKMYTKSMYKNTFSLFCCLWEKKIIFIWATKKQLVKYTIVFKYSMSIKNNAFNELFFAEQEYT